jgi:TonB family protein
MARTIINIAVILLFSSQLALIGQERLDLDAAERLLIERPAPEYPDLAARNGVNAPVNLLATVSEAGTVSDVKLLGGHPMLNAAAIEAVQKSKYKPYVVGGKAVPFYAPVEIVFGLSAKDYARDQKLASQFYEQEDKCRDFLKAADWQKANEICGANLALAEKFGKHRVNLKMHAHQMVGQAFLGQNKYQDAIKSLTRALNIGRSELDENNPAFGDVFEALGRACSKAGQHKDALVWFNKAEKTFQTAYINIRDVAYQTRLKQALQYHIEAADAAGDAKESAISKQLLAAMQ